MSVDGVRLILVGDLTRQPLGVGVTAELFRVVLMVDGTRRAILRCSVLVWCCVDHYALKPGDMRQVAGAWIEAAKR